MRADNLEGQKTDSKDELKQRTANPWSTAQKRNERRRRIQKELGEKFKQN